MLEAGVKSRRRNTSTQRSSQLSDHRERGRMKVGVDEGKPLEVILVDFSQHVWVRGRQDRRGGREELVKILPFLSSLWERNVVSRQCILSLCMYSIKYDVPLISSVTLSDGSPYLDLVRNYLLISCLSWRCVFCAYHYIRVHVWEARLRTIILVRRNENVCLWCDWKRHGWREREREECESKSERDCLFVGILLILFMFNVHRNPEGH